MILAKIKQVVALAETLFNVDLSNLQLRTDLRGTSMGTASMTNDGKLLLRLSKQGCAELPEAIMSDTIPHEIAHLVCFIKGIDNGHGENWKAVARALGSLGDRLHEQKLKPAIRTFEYLASSGAIVELTIIRHNKLQRGKVLTYSGKDGDITKHDLIGET